MRYYVISELTSLNSLVFKIQEEFNIDFLNFKSILVILII